MVTAQIDQTLHPVASVSLVYRAMYQPEVTARMADDGQGADRAAQDGVYTGVIPAGAATAGQMLRYYVVARDTTGSSQRAPRITDTTGTGRSAEYYGTVIADPTLTDPLPAFLWFTNDVAGSRSPTGARASVLYGGEFYDNVFVRQRGRSPTANPRSSISMGITCSMRMIGSDACRKLTSTAKAMIPRSSGKRSRFKRPNSPVMPHPIHFWSRCV